MMSSRLDGGDGFSSGLTEVAAVETGWKAPAASRVAETVTSSNTSWRATTTTCTGPVWSAGTSIAPSSKRGWVTSRSAGSTGR